MSLDLQQFLDISDRMAENPMSYKAEAATIEYPLILVKGITDIEREYYKNLPDFLSTNKKSENSVQLVVKLGNDSILLGYVPMALKTFIILNTLKDRECFVLPNSETALPVDDSVLMKFICQDTTR